MKSLAILIVTGLVIFNIQAQMTDLSENAANRTSSMTSVATSRVREKYAVELYQQPEKVKFNLAGSDRTRTWTLLFLEATELKPDTTRRVWSIYHPWDISVHKGALHEFTFGARNENVIALTYLVGRKEPVVNFYEIDLTDIALEKIPDQSPRPGTAYVATECLLLSDQDRHFLPLSVLKEAYGEEKSKSLIAENDLRIKNVVWSDNHWKLTLALGQEEFTFVREEDGETWRLEGKQP